MKRVLRNNTSKRHQLHSPCTAQHFTLQADHLPNGEALLWTSQGGDKTSGIKNQPEASPKTLSHSGSQADLTSFTHDSNLAKSNSHECLYNSPSPNPKALFPDFASPSRYNPRFSPADARNSIICEQMDDMLFTHYRDHVFHIQYPFHHTLESFKGQLLSILRRDSSAYHATLALSGYDRYSTLSTYDDSVHISVLLQAANEHYEISFQKMQLSLRQASMWSEMTALERSVGTLVSIHQLLYWEVR